MAFDELAAFEAGAGSDEGDEVGCVHDPPASLGGLDELEDHREGGGGVPLLEWLAGEQAIASRKSITLPAPASAAAAFPGSP